MDEQEPHFEPVERERYVDPAPLFAALAEAWCELENPIKSSTVSFPGRTYKYADLAVIFDTIRPVLGKHGLAVIQMPSMRESRVAVTTALVHKSGAQVISTLETPAPDTSQAKGVQAIGSAITYLRRYALVSMLGIAADEDDDGEAASQATAAPKRAKAGPAPEKPWSERERSPETAAGRAAFKVVLDSAVGRGQLPAKIAEEENMQQALLAYVLGTWAFSMKDASKSEWDEAVAKLQEKLSDAAWKWPIK